MADAERQDRPQIGIIEPGVIRIEPPEEELWTDDSGTDYTGWFCVRTNPWPCPAEGCSFVAMFLTAAHLVIVWPERDDPTLLRHSAVARDVGRNPRIEQYEASFGPACSYYQWEAAGNPVHGVRAPEAQG
jgi:hypothetical protein